MAVVSVVKLSQVEGTCRLDADYYQPEYMEAKNRLSVIKNVVRLRNIASIATGPAYSSKEMGEDFDIPVARIGDVTNKTDVEDWIKLSRAEFEKFDCKKIESLDILMTMTGDPPDVGKCNLIKIPNDRNLAFNQRVVKISAKISPYYLFAYLSTEIARMQSERSALGIRQRNVGINDLKNILVVLPSSNTLRLTIDNLVSQYLAELENSKSLYSEAENLLLEELGLKDFKPKYELSYTANLSKAFGLRRIDAEYFQPVYDSIEEHLVKNFGARPIGKIGFINVTTGQYSEEYVERSEGKPYIRGVDIKKGSISTDALVHIGSKNQIESKKAREGDVVVTRVGTIGLSARIPKECEDGTISDNLIRLRFDQEKLNSHYLALFLGSPVGVCLMIRNSRGSVQQRLNQETLKGLVVPILPSEIQQEIASLIQQSHEARRKAKELLEEAKRKVEQEIEAASIDQH